MNAKEIEAVFYQVFFEHYQTVLVGGYTEPFYGCSKKNTDPHRICYRFDYVASALHEVAHWCIAGKNRRKLDDYGYWYSPDGRDNAQQKNFYKVEALPQALEKYFHQCIGSKDFHLSLDNLGSELLEEDISSFKGLVDDYFDKIIRGVMPVRAKEFSQKLKELSLARQNV